MSDSNDTSLDFDPTTVDAADPFEVLPDGTRVIAELVKCERKTSKKGDGSQYLNAEFVQLEGGSRHFFTIFNDRNKSDKARAIAQREIGALCLAAAPGKSIKDLMEVAGIPVVLVLGVEPARGDYPAKNKIKNYMSVDGVKPAAAAAPAKGGAAPWAKPAA